MLRRWPTGVLAVGWLLLAVYTFVVQPLTLDNSLACAGSNYGRVEWTVWPPGPVCVNLGSPIPEHRLWSWTMRAAFLAGVAPVLVISYIRSRRGRVPRRPQTADDHRPVGQERRPAES